MRMTTIAAGGVGLVMLAAAGGWLVSDLEGTRLEVERLNFARGSAEELVRSWVDLGDSLGRAATDYDVARDRAAYRTFVQASDFTPHSLSDLGLTRRNPEGESIETLSDQLLGLGADMVRRSENIFGIVAVHRNSSDDSQSPFQTRLRRLRVAAEAEAAADITRRAMSRIDATNTLLAEEVESLVDHERTQSRRLYGLIGGAIVAVGLFAFALRRAVPITAHETAGLGARTDVVLEPEAVVVPVDPSDLVPCGAVFTKPQPPPARPVRREERRTPARVETSAWSVQVSPSEKIVSWEGRTILVVEDDAQVRTLAREVLRGRGYGVLEARNGLEAARIAEQESVALDLVLSDVVMPRMSGHELVERLALLRPELPVLLMSGYLDDAIAPREGAACDRPLIHKPFSPEDLVRRVRQVMQREPERL